MIIFSAETIVYAEIKPNNDWRDTMVYMTGGLMRVKEMLPSLPPSEKKIANYILKNPQDVISQTANELGKHSLTSSAAVIRLCKSLNLKGFHELKIRIA